MMMTQTLSAFELLSLIQAGGVEPTLASPFMGYVSALSERGIVPGEREARAALESMLARGGILCAGGKPTLAPVMRTILGDMLEPEGVSHFQTADDCFSGIFFAKKAGRLSMLTFEAKELSATLTWELPSGYEWFTAMRLVCAKAGAAPFAPGTAVLTEEEYGELFGLLAGRESGSREADESLAGKGILSLEGEAPSLVPAYAARFKGFGAGGAVLLSVYDADRVVLNKTQLVSCDGGVVAAVCNRPSFGMYTLEFFPADANPYIVTERIMLGLPLEK